MVPATTSTSATAGEACEEVEMGMTSPRDAAPAPMPTTYPQSQDRLQVHGATEAYAQRPQPQLALRLLPAVRLFVGPVQRTER